MMRQYLETKARYPDAHPLLPAGRLLRDVLRGRGRRLGGAPDHAHRPREGGRQGPDVRRAAPRRPRLRREAPREGVQGRDLRPGRAAREVDPRPPRGDAGRHAGDGPRRPGPRSAGGELPRRGGARRRRRRARAPRRLDGRAARRARSPPTRGSWTSCAAPASASSSSRPGRTRRGRPPSSRAVGRPGGAAPRRRLRAAGRPAPAPPRRREPRRLRGGAICPSGSPRPPPRSPTSPRRSARRRRHVDRLSRLRHRRRPPPRRGDPDEPRARADALGRQAEGHAPRAPRPDRHRARRRGVSPSGSGTRSPTSSAIGARLDAVGGARRRRRCCARSSASALRPVARRGAAPLAARAGAGQRPGPARARRRAPRAPRARGPPRPGGPPPLLQRRGRAAARPRGRSPPSSTEPSPRSRRPGSRRAGSIRRGYSRRARRDRGDRRGRQGGHRPARGEGARAHRDRVAQGPLQPGLRLLHRGHQAQPPPRPEGLRAAADDGGRRAVRDRRAEGVRGEGPHRRGAALRPRGADLRGAAGEGGRGGGARSGARPTRWRPRTCSSPSRASRRSAGTSGRSWTRRRSWRSRTGATRSSRRCSPGGPAASSRTTSRWPRGGAPECESHGCLQVITGPNMAGKSTVMRQAALITLLAQMGSFVPARRARVGVVDRIFTRVGASDDLARGRSTFMVEMTETAAILHNATRRSLVVLDEIGRGTSTFDGVSIAWAVAEHLHDAVGCRTLFATHYHELQDLARERPAVRNLTVAVREVGEQVVFLRKLVPGRRVAQLRDRGREARRAARRGAGPRPGDPAEPRGDGGGRGRSRLPRPRPRGGRAPGRASSACSAGRRSIRRSRRSRRRCGRSTSMRSGRSTR